MNHLPGMVYCCEASLPRRMTFVSNQVEALTGHPPEAFTKGGLAWAELIHPDDLEGVAGKVAEGIAEGGRVSAAYRNLHRDGAQRWVIEQGVVVDGPDGPILEGFVQDDSDHHRTEVALRTGQSYLSSVFDQALVGILHRDLNHRIIHVNKAFCDLVGRTAEEIDAVPGSELWHPDDASEIFDQFRRNVVTGTPYFAERRYVRPDGTEIWGEIQVSFVRGEDGAVESMILLMIDASQRREVDQQRARAIEMLRIALQGAQAGTYELDLGDFSLKLSPEAVRIYGLPSEHDGCLTHEDWLALVNPEDAARPPSFAPAGDGILPSRTFEFRLRERDGVVRWLRALSHPEPIVSGARRLIVGMIFDDTERKLAEQTLQAREAHLRLVQEAAHIGSYQIGSDLNAVCSRQFFRNLGLDENSVSLPEEAFFALIHPEDRQRVWDDGRSAMASDSESFECEFRIIRANDGEVRWMFNRTRYLRDPRGHPIGALGAQMDVTDRKRAEQAARAGEALNLSIIQASADGITLLDGRGRTSFMNGHALAAAGVAELAEVAAKPWADCWPVQVHGPLRAAVSKALKGGVGRFTGCSRNAQGDEKWWDVAVTPVAGEARGETALLAISRDVTEQRRSVERVRWAAGHDAMTGLPNRRVFQEQLQASLVEAAATDTSVGLLILDIDHFKEVNDERGHDAGDAVLRVFGQRLRDAVRPTDTVARLGGDEFAVILRHLREPDEMATILPPVLEALHEPFTYLGRSLDCRASVGAALYPDQGLSPDELMKNADLALYAAKLSRRGGVTMFAPDMRSEMQKRLSMLNLARDAIREGLIVPFYQPQVDLRTGRPVGFEALLRLRHPDLGIQLPATIAEAFGDVALARQLGARMQQQVFADMRSLLDRGIAFGRVAINTSGAEFRNDDFAETMLERLEQAGVPYELVEVEITEKTVFQGKNTEHVARALRMLRAHHVRVALDDFGTGFSSLSHLKEFAVDALKIDQSFIRDLGDDPDSDDTAIVLAVLNLGRSLKIEVVAEGVEQAKQAAFLRANGCDIGQGYLFGRAVPVAEIAALVHPPQARRA
ncbi:MAG: EAL domain-containing protein [Allosphingosinicella sp.]